MKILALICTVWLLSMIKVVGEAMPVPALAHSVALIAN